LGVSFDFKADLSAARAGIDHQIGEFMANQRNYLAALDSELAPAALALESFLLRSGKRFRPLLAYAGLIAAKTQIGARKESSQGKEGAEEKSPNNSGVISKAELKALTSLEFVHVAALIHDDVMDRSDTRRGLPSIHRLFESEHKQLNWGGDGEQYGVASAILLGDLALIWASQNLHQCFSGLSGKGEDGGFELAFAIFDEMQVEVMAGQFLDITEQVKLEHSVERALKVATFKSSKYSVERPLQFGAAIGGANQELLGKLSEFGIPLGIAFQLRDDLLGVFGDEAETGKPSGGDLIEGKRTALIALSLAGMSHQDATAFTACFGRSDASRDEIELMQALITASGGIEGVEELITSHYQKSLAALDDDIFSESALEILRELAARVVNRSA
jgi:geranylgeranyl diphosphate synthase type I